MTTGKPRVFISHASGDKGLIKPIALALLRSGYGLFIDRPEDLDWGIRFCRENDIAFLGGGDYGAQLRAAVRDADAILGCLSTNLSNARDVWKEELIIAEHYGKLALCRIDDVDPAAFDDIDTGTIQLERLQSRMVRVPQGDPLAPVEDEVVEKLLDNTAFSFVLDHLEQLTRGAAPVAEAPIAVSEAPPQPQAPPQAPPMPEEPVRDWVDLSYAVHPDAEPVPLPGIIKVFSDLGQAEDPPPLADRRFMEIDVDRFNDVMRAMRPMLRFRVDHLLGDEEELLAIELEFKDLFDFQPYWVARQVPLLATLVETRDALRNLGVLMDGKPEGERFLASLLEAPDAVRLVLEAGPEGAVYDPQDPSDETSLDMTPWEVSALLERDFRVQSDEARRQLHQGVHALCVMIDAGNVHFWDSVPRVLDEANARLEHMLSQQLNPILHHPDFQRLEGAWRGLAHLVQSVADLPGIRVEALNVTKRELWKDFQMNAGAHWERSAVHRWLCEDTYDTLGGVPALCVVVDYTFDHGSLNTDLLRSLALNAEAAQTVCLTGASPYLLNLDRWSELPLLRDPAARFEMPEYARWHVLRETEFSRHLALVAPRFAARSPYRHDHAPDTKSGFEEDLEPVWDDNTCWANAAYIGAATIARAMARYGWPAQGTGIDGAPAIDTLPALVVPDASLNAVQLCPTEVDIPLRRARDLEALGLLPLAHQRDTTRASFLGHASLNRPLEYVDAELTQAAANAVDLRRFLPACRVAQVVRCMIRDLAGNHGSTEALCAAVNDWLATRVAQGDASDARRPLRAAELRMEEGGRAVLEVAPAYQVKGVHTPVTFVFGTTL